MTGWKVVTPQVDDPPTRFHNFCLSLVGHEGGWQVQVTDPDITTRDPTVLEEVKVQPTTVEMFAYDLIFLILKDVKSFTGNETRAEMTYKGDLGTRYFTFSRTSTRAPQSWPPPSQQTQ